MLARVLEPELMDTHEEALAYDTMDHADVNRRFVEDLIEFASAATGDPWAEALDLGTGTAQQPIELCRRVDGARVVAVDAAEHMLDVARNNIEVASLTDRILLDLVDAKNLPYDAGRFSVVFSNSIVHHIPNPLDVLREAVRVTAPGGVLFFRDLLRPNTDAELELIVATYAADASEHQRELFSDSLRAALTLDEMRKLVASLGFARDTVSQSSDRHWTWAAAHE